MMTAVAKLITKCLDVHIITAFLDKIAAIHMTRVNLLSALAVMVISYIAIPCQWRRQALIIV